MMATVTVEIIDKQLRAKLAELASDPQNREAIHRGVTRSAQAVSRQAKLQARSLFGQGRRSKSKAPSGRGGAQLVKSIGVIDDITRLQADVGPSVIYGRIHELGGRIRPEHAKYLSVPIGTAWGSPRRYKLQLAFRKSAGRGLTKFLADESGKLQYVLVDQVDIPARPYMGPALKQAAPQIRREFERVVERLAG